MTYKNEVVAYVFGYGSLVSKESRDKTVKVNGAVIGKIHHLRRIFNAVGTYNNPNNYKYFTEVDASGNPVLGQMGEELCPRFMPVYLNVIPEVGASTVGVYIPVTRDQLKAFDEREANYYKQDVTHLVDPDVYLVHDVPVFTYVAKTSSQMRITVAGAYIPSVYWESVTKAFEEEDLLDDFLATTEVPVRKINVGLPTYLSEY